jgi:hypothetical protein
MDKVNITDNIQVEITECEGCGKDIGLETETIHHDTDLPVFMVKEFKTKRATNPITLMPYLYAKDVEWALKASGSTILRVEYELTKFASNTFYQAIKNSFLSKYEDEDEHFDGTTDFKNDERWLLFCKQTIKDFKQYEDK